MSSDEIINEYLKAALENLDSVMAEIFKVPHEQSRELYSLGLLGRSIGLIREFQHPILIRNPELKPLPPEDYIPDREMDEKEEMFASTLSPVKLKEIDSVLLSYASSRYSKVAALVAKIITNGSVHVDGLPDVFYSRRIKYLVENKRLESQGNLDMMRYSEVRLPQDAHSD